MPDLQIQRRIRADGIGNCVLAVTRSARSGKALLYFGGKMRHTVVLGVVIAVCLAFCRVSPAAGPSVEEMAGAMLMVGFRGTVPPQELLEGLESGAVGGVILFDRDTASRGERNIVSPDQVRQLTAALQAHARYPLLIAVDQEGGRVVRLSEARGFTPLPSAMAMGAQDVQSTYCHAYQTGLELSSLGINVNLAPVADVRRSACSPGLGDKERLFGNTPAQVSAHADAFARGLLAAGVMPALKHFPGLGSATLDSHSALPDVTESWSEDELLPYRDAIASGWTGMFLVGHVLNRRLDPALPASLSPAVIEGLLRRQLGFEGVVISDDLGMGAVSGTYPLEELIRLAVLAGNDILLFCNNGRDYDPALAARAHAALVDLVRQGRIEPERLRVSWERLKRFKAGLR